MELNEFILNVAKGYNIKGNEKDILKFALDIIDNFFSPSESCIIALKKFVREN